MAADGKSVKNVLGFPGIFRGAVDAYAPRITHEMYLAAAKTIAEMTPPGELAPTHWTREYIMPLFAPIMCRMWMNRRQTVAIDNQKVAC